MAMDELRQQARSWLLGLAECVYPDEHGNRLAEQVDELQEHIRQGYAELLRQRRLCEELQQRVANEEQRVTALPWKVLSYVQTNNRRAAWQAALELDQARGLLETDRARLRQLQRDYQEQGIRLAADRQRLGALQRQLLRLRPTLRFAS